MNPSRAPAGAAVDRAAVHRTLRALLASGLGILPLCELFTGKAWLLDAWLAMIIAIGPALLMRTRRWPGALQVWPGIVLLIPWLTARFVHQDALFGFIPLAATWHDVGALMSELHSTAQNGVAPVPASIAIKLALCALLGLLAALIDLLAVVGRHGALAAVPLLIIYTVSGAVTREPVSWVLFCGCAVAFVLLLSLDAKTTVRDWGTLIPRPGTSGGRPVRAISGQRIAVVAIALAVVLPLAAPSEPSNLIADALHGSSSSTQGFGAGGGRGSSISPFVALKGQLQRSKPMQLATVDISAPNGQDPNPFYLRTNVLSEFRGDGWAAGSHKPTAPLSSGSLHGRPPTQLGTPATQFTARITVSGMRGNPAIFAQPVAITGLDDGQWSIRDQLVIGTDLSKGTSYIEQVRQPNPGVSELAAAPDAYGQRFQQWLHLPQIPRSVRALVAQTVRGHSGPYARARAISDFFADPANGFTYSLSTVEGDSNSDLVNFLNNRVGYCQQYAAAMAVMLRLAGVPSRVVLGYTHLAPDSHGTFTVTTQDAHAWVEAYFIGVGWIPFDPTPVAGIHGGAAHDLAWAPHESEDPNPNPSTAPAPAGPLPQQRLPQLPAVPDGAAAGPTNTSSSSDHPLLWTVVALLALAFLLALVPAGTRIRRRRRRLWAGRRGDPSPLWAELADTALDLGYHWTPARSPRQVAQWLREPAGPAAASLQRLAASLERHRYAGPPDRPERTAGLVGELAAVRKQLRTGRDLRTRLRAMLWAPSLGWRLRPIQWLRRRRASARGGYGPR